MGAIPPVEAIPHTASLDFSALVLSVPATTEGKCFGGLYRTFRFVFALIQFGARATWREARAESTEDQRGILHTVVNRAAKAGW